LQKEEKLNKTQVEEVKIYEKFQTLLKNQKLKCIELESQLTGLQPEISQLVREMGKITAYYEEYNLMLSDGQQAIYEDCKRKSQLIYDCTKVDLMDEQQLERL
jgi:hypothetical protein